MTEARSLPVQTDAIPEVTIVSYPNYYMMPIGTRVRFVIETKNGEPLPEGLQYQWQCINDPATVRSSTSSRFRGPNQPEWNNALWSVAGWHTILLTIHNPSTGAIKRIEYPQIVDHAANIMNAQLGKEIESDDVTPFQYLLQIKNYRDVLLHIAKEKPPRDDQAERHNNRVIELTNLIERLEALLSGTSDKPGFPVKAVHVDKETNTRTVLRLWLVHTNSRYPNREFWRLIDWTSPGYRNASGVYDAASQSHEQAIKNVLSRWDTGNRYPEGNIRYEVNINRYGIRLDETVATDGASFWDSVSTWLGYTALAAGLLALAIAPIPGSRVAAFAIYSVVASGTAGTASAVINIASRHADGFSNGRDDLFDGLSIVGNVFGMGAAWRLGAMFTSGAKMGTGMTKAVIIGQVGSDGLQGILLGAEYLAEFEDIKDAEYLSPEARLNKMLELFRSAAVVGALTLVSVGGGALDMRSVSQQARITDLMTPGSKINLDAAVPPTVTPIRAEQRQVQQTIDYEITQPALNGPNRGAPVGTLVRASKVYVNPKSFTEAEDMLKEAKLRLLAGGKPLKYSDDELLELVKHADKFQDNYIVRFMEKAHLHDRYDTIKAETNRTGKLGAVNEHGEVKFWSTTFDYIVDSDSDPDLVRRTIGMGNDYFRPSEDYVLVLIDAKKYAELGSLTFSPTYKNMQEFVIKARASGTPEDQRRILQVLSDDYTLGTAQRKGYRQLMEEVQARDIKLDKKETMDDFLTQTFGSNKVDSKLFEMRYQLEKDYGMYKEYAGNGLTKSEHVGPQQFATVETFSVETNPNTLQKLLDDNIIHIVELGKHQK